MTITKEPQKNKKTNIYRSLYNFEEFKMTQAILLLIASIFFGNLYTATMAVYAITKSRYQTKNSTIVFLNGILKAGWCLLAISFILILAASLT